MKSRTEPSRTCLGCRRTQPRSEMIRLVRGLKGELLVDLQSRLPGRGTYVCPSPECLKALRPGSLSHVLKAPVDLPDFEALITMFHGSLENQARNLLTIGRKSGNVAVGAEAVRKALSRKAANLLVFAVDTAEQKKTEFTRLGDGIPTRILSDKETLGCWLGRGNIGVLAVSSKNICAALMKTLDRLSALAYYPYGMATGSKLKEELRPHG